MQRFFWLSLLLGFLTAMAGEVEWLTPTRPRLCLNGNWQFQPQSGEFRPPQGGWDKVPIRIPSPWNVNSFSRGQGGDFNLYPSYPASWEEARMGWHRRTFNIPSVMKGMRIFLRFEAVHYYCEVYVNGKIVGSHEGGFTPFEFDITDAINWDGENELLVGVKDISFFMVGGSAPFPWGSFWGGHIRGIWQDVYLLARPALFISGVFVRTSVRRKELRVEAEVVNKTAKPTDAFLSFQVIDKEGKRVELSVPPRDVSLNPGEAMTVRWRVRWENPHLWGPDDPYLYTLKVSLSAPSLTDEWRTRFGFREFWIEGSNFYLNGQRIKLRGDAWHYMGIPYQTPEYARLWYRMAKETGLNHIRLHAQVYPSFYLDIADEEGMLITDESAIWASACNFLYNDDFWRRAKEHVREFVLRDRNHPSVIIWSVANEIMAAHGVNPHDGAPSLDWLFAKIYDLVQEIKNLDGTRPVSSDGDEDLGGRGEIFSLHYPGPQKPSTQKPITIGESGSMFYSTPPQVAPTAGEGVYLNFSQRLKGVGEELRMLFPAYRKWAQQITPFNVVWYSLEPLPIQSLPLSYKDLETPGVKPERWGAYCSTLNPGYDPSLPKWKPNALYPYIKELLQPVTFFPNERNSSFFSGEEIKRSFSVFNDTSAPASLEIRCKVTRAGQEMFSKAIPLQIPAGEYRDVEFSFKAPETGEEDVLSMEASLWKEDGGWSNIKEETYSIYIFPSSISLPFQPYILGDPSLFPFPSRQLDDPAMLPPREVLVVARTLSAKEVEALLQKVEEGARCIVLEGGRELSKSLSLSWRASSGEHVFAPFPHPILKDLKGENLLFWRKGRVFKEAWTSPLKGTLIPIGFCSAGDVALLEVKRGKGTLILSGLDLLNQLRDEPVALAILRNALLYLQSLPENRYPSVGIMVGGNPVLNAILSSLGIIDGKTIGEKEMGSVDIILADERGLPSPEALRDFLNRGGKLFVFNPTSEGASKLNKVLSSPIEIVPSEDVQLVRARNDGLCRGLYLDWLYWLGEKDAKSIMRYSIRTKEGEPLLLTSETDWRRWNWEGENVKTASILKAELERASKERSCALVSIKVGEGEVIISEIRVDISHPKFWSLLSLLLSNLGIGMKPGETPEVFTDEEGFICNWLVLGPFQGGLADKLIEEEGVRHQEMMVSGGRVWRKVFANPLDFTSLFGKISKACAYAGIYVYSPRDVDVVLLLGSDDGIAVWLDGEEVWRNPAVRPLQADVDKVPLKLSKGWHSLFLKVSQETGEWGLCARLVDEEGQVLKDLRYSLLPPDGVKGPTPYGWTAKAEPGGNEALAFDRDPSTRWTSGRPMRSGMYYLLDMGKEEEISQVILDFAQSPGDYPRGCRVEVSSDGREWRIVSELNAEEVERRISGGVLGISFPRTRVRYVRITQLGSHDWLFWSIHEIYIF